MLSICRLALATSLLASASIAQDEVDSLPPVVHTGGNSGLDYRVDCNNAFGPGSAVTSVQLDGSASYDPNGTPVTFFWRNECGAFGWFDDPTSPAPVYHVDMSGACERSCWIALRVTSGGQTSVKGFQVFVEDATAPTLSAPLDVMGIHGDSVDVAQTGLPLVSDNCDPAPTVTYADVELPQTGPGQPELILQRTWKATDCAGFESTSVQMILLLAPTGAIGSRANLDFAPGSCPNVYNTAPTGTVDAVLLGVQGFKTERVIKNTVRLSLRQNPSVSIAPVSFQLKDLGSLTASTYGECNAAVLDGQKDLRLRFDRSALSAQLGLGLLTSGQTVEVVITGRMTGSKLFSVRDTIVIQ